MEMIYKIIFNKINKIKISISYISSSKWAILSLMRISIMLYLTDIINIWNK